MGAVAVNEEKQNRASQVPRKRSVHDGWSRKSPPDCFSESRWELSRCLTPALTFGDCDT